MFDYYSMNSDLPGPKALGMYSTCIHCGKQDQTYIKRVKKQSFDGKRVWCARCKRAAGF